MRPQGRKRAEAKNRRYRQRTTPFHNPSSFSYSSSRNVYDKSSSTIEGPHLRDSPARLRFEITKKGNNYAHYSSRRKVVNETTDVNKDDGTSVVQSGRLFSA